MKPSLGILVNRINRSNENFIDHRPKETSGNRGNDDIFHESDLYIYIYINCETKGFG